MIDRYIEKGTMYVLEDGNVKAECVVTDEDNGILEIKNIADVYKRQPVTSTQMVLAKIIVLFLFGIIFCVASTLATILLLFPILRVHCQFF